MKNSSAYDQINHRIKKNALGSLQHKPKACKVEYNKRKKMYLERTRTAKNAGKLTALSQELTELKNHPFRKEKHFAEQQQHIEQSKQQLGLEFQI